MTLSHDHPITLTNTDNATSYILEPTYDGYLAKNQQTTRSTWLPFNVVAFILSLHGKEVSHDHFHLDKAIRLELAYQQYSTMWQTRTEPKQSVYSLAH